MNIMKKTILSTLLFLGVLSAQAQDQQQGTVEYDFTPHWYVQIQPLGIQHTLGELDFSKLNSYNVQAAAGYNFNKIMGARLAVSAWQSKAGIEVDRTDINAGRYIAKWSWKYVAPSVDLTFNLSNMFFGVNPDRLFDLGAFIGIGANVAFSNDDAWTANTALNNYLKSGWQDKTKYQNQNMEYLWDGTKVRVLGRAGLTGDFRINDKIKVGLELNANTLSDKYNSKKAGNADWYFNALAGVKIALGETYSTRIIPPVEPEIRYIDREVPVLSGSTDQAETSSAMMVQREPLRRDIFFRINSWKIRESEAQKVADVAEYLNKYPDAKVVMTGYADKGTGNARINARLAAQRANAVKDALVKQYNISLSRITYDSKGDTVQPFAENDKNRVTICIAE
jgi:outer membrane protein OmpA-like peptidoglycan-associated protein